ncbi:MAG: 60S ribosomal export protein NMD3 [Candidatus Diapherotrites archaeon]|nr:60S ribosomal export protein NMD3 [Candidatus Diapherotrites archaeon]
MRYFCPECGKSVNKLFDKLCSKCYLELKNPIKVNECLELLVCRSCGKIKVFGRWLEKNNESLKNFVMNNISFSNLKITDAALDFYQKDYGYDVKLVIRISNNKKEFRFEKKFKIFEKKVLCESCLKLSGQYYEGILQLRGNFNKDKLLNEVNSFFEKEKLEDSLASVVSIEQLKEGIDLKIGSARSLKRLVKNVLSKFNVEVLETYSVVGYDRQKNKMKKRVTFCVRFL